MQKIDVEPGSEEWDRIRAVRPTASRFKEIITPARGEYSKQAFKYACQIVAARMGLATPEPPPTTWMEWGSEQEPNAIHAYQKQFNVRLDKCGFAMPDETDVFGCSPDALINLRQNGGQWLCDGGVEIKCVKAETLLMMHHGNGGDLYAKPQIQGQMLICGCDTWDFYAWHPELEPYHLRIEADHKYQGQILAALSQFLETIRDLESKVKRFEHEIIYYGGNEIVTFEG